MPVKQKNFTNLEFGNTVRRMRQSTGQNIGNDGEWAHFQYSNCLSYRKISTAFDSIDSVQVSTPY